MIRILHAVHPVEGEISIEEREEKLRVRCRWPFDLQLDDFIEISLAIDSAQSSKFIRDLAGEGHATVIDDDGDTLLSVDRRSSATALYVSNGQQGFQRRTLELSLPPTTQTEVGDE